MRPGEGYLLTTRGHCDCGTALGILRQERRSRPDEDEIDEVLARESAKLRKKGWSAARIQRWLESKWTIHERSERQAGQRVESHWRPDADRWLTFLREALRSGAASRAGILVHWYDGTIEHERFPLLNRLELDVAPVATDDLLEMKSDTLYEFRATRPQTVHSFESSRHLHAGDP